MGGRMRGVARSRALSPHFSSLVYYVAAIIRPGCVLLRRPPRRTARVRLRGPRSQALPGRPLRRLATTSDEKSGLEAREVNTIKKPARSIPTGLRLLAQDFRTLGKRQDRSVLSPVRAVYIATYLRNRARWYRRTPAGLDTRNAARYPGFGNPGLEDGIPSGFTSS